MFYFFNLFLVQFIFFLFLWYIIPSFNLPFSVDFFYSIFFFDDGCLDGDDISYIIELDDFENAPSYFYFISIFLCVAVINFFILFFLIFFEYMFLLIGFLYSSVFTKNEFYLSFLFMDIFSIIFFFELLELVYFTSDIFFYNIDNILFLFDLQGLDYSDNIYDLKISSFSNVSFLVFSLESFYFCFNYYFLHLFFDDFLEFLFEFFFFW